MFVLAAVLFNAVIAFMMAGRWGFIIYGPPVALARQTAWFARPDRWLVLIGCAAASFYYVWMAFKGKGSRWPLLIAILNLVSLLIFDGLVGDSIRNP